MTKLGKILSVLGAVNMSHEKVRLLHPIGIATLPFWLIIAVFVCMFTDENIVDSFKYNYCVW